MDIYDLSITFTTRKMDECREFYQKYFNGRITFDSGWYFTVTFFNGGSKVSLSFLNPDNDYTTYPGSEITISGGVTLNMLVEDPDKEYEKYKDSGIEIIQELGDSPWGDHSFLAKDPIGNSLYIYKWIKPSAEFADSYLDKEAYAGHGIFDNQ